MSLIRVKFANECQICECCDDFYCTDCDDHYFSCKCIGPHQDNEYEYLVVKGDLFAVRIHEEKQ